ncbi:hypothetical protein FB45DRAFT_916547 [Roridomyces roridus]|uniref:Amino-acid acetyltransferase, mitochondrial n=1 Tax=Roridomyces roridus TaxID=1738132 RepID=A0AAD7BU19_9AGAR|nr:hypothetical protein FB45DRAFT_916547 [Roridomyces roridus]
MLPPVSRVRVPPALARRQTFKAFYAPPPEPEDIPPAENVSTTISSCRYLRANPSLRDTRSYLASFGPRPKPAEVPSADRLPLPVSSKTVQSTPIAVEHPKPSPVLTSILEPVVKRTALVKVQGPFTDVQLESIARGLVYLEKLGLVSVIVVDNDTLPRGEQDQRAALVEETMRLGAMARPVLGAVDETQPDDFDPPEAHTFPSDFVPIRSALRAGEIPVIPPFALDSFCRSVRVDANDVLGALARGMSAELPDDVDLTPLRLMIINREGGVPSYARSGYPHLLINLTSEYSHIHDTFHEPWHNSNPSALANLALARTSVMVSHRSPSSLIANLITNKPGNRRLTAHTPTLLRRGLPIRVLRSSNDIDRPKLNALLEHAFYQRLDRTLDFVVIAGDYVGAAIGSEPISYLDKFAVLPSHQGDGTVDFLWVALHDESYGKGGVGEGRDLVWRSRANNPVNKWYFERSSGHVRMGSWVLFWCDAEKRLRLEQASRATGGMSYVEKWEEGRLGQWGDVVQKIPSSWK